MRTPFLGKLTKSTLYLTLVAVVCGMMLRLSYPPSGFPCLVFFAMVPLLVASPLLSASDRLYTGFVVGVLAHIDFAGAFVGWGYSLTFLPVFAMGILFGVLVLFTGALQTRLPIFLKWSAMACIWPWVSLVGESLVGIPLSLAGVFALTESRILTTVSIIGALGVDFLILTVSGVIAGLISHELPIRHAVCVLSILGVIQFVTARYTAKVEIEQSQILVALVQPAISIAHQQRAKWSLAERNTREATVDALTSQAIEAGAELVVWPEGGNGLSNLRLLRRLEKFNEFTIDTGVTLIASGTDLTPDGKEFNIVHQVESGTVVADAMKSRPVTFSETTLERGKPTVLDTKWGMLGISVCYDSIFSQHAHKLKADGAEVILVVSNDSSFGYAATQYWHAALSVLRGIEVSLPVIFHSNNGISLVSSNHGEILYFTENGEAPGILQWSFPKSSGSSKLPYRVIQLVSFAPLLALLSLLFWRARRKLS